ncbi:MAG: hypothetical protein ABSE28_24095 [Candidatus Sulfotelmatobacter sp.]|jgi:hypothetical protein
MKRRPAPRSNSGKAGAASSGSGTAIAPVVILLHGMNYDTEPQIDAASPYLLEITKFTTLG